MSKELDELTRKAIEYKKQERARHKERYQYARSLGLSSALAVQLLGSSKEKILRVSKELKETSSP